ncbi:MAG: S8 family serine peptidase [Bacteroidales bacterium]|nr:S8 family serine peptidase [Bacteroidales bacterium]
MKKHLIVLAAVAVIGTACTKESGIEGTTERQTLASKLVGGDEGEAVPGCLLVQLEENAASLVREGRIKEISEELFAGIQAESFTPALPVKPKNAEIARKYGLDRWFTVRFDEDTPAERVAVQMAASPKVSRIQYNRYVTPIRTDDVFPAQPLTRMSPIPAEDNSFDDPYASSQWNLCNDGSISSEAVAGADVGVKDAWRLTGGDPSVIVAVFDCAIATRHEDLEDAVWQNEAEVNGEAGADDDGNGFIDDKYGFNFVGCYAINEDYISGALDGSKQTAVKGDPLNSTAGSGHGTHVAGIIGATNNNGKGVSSIAGGTGNGDGVRLMSCQIFKGSSYCADAQNAAAFIYAADNGACIAQCSYGNSNIITNDDLYINGGELNGTKVSASTLENAALKYFLDPANSNHESLEGNMAIFAAGNHQNPYSSYPGALPYVISVTAFGWDFLPSGYTNYGPGCKIAAPGGEWSGASGDYAGMILSTGVSGAATQSPGVETEKGTESKNYVYMQGTSMACPHVSGVVALGISYTRKLGKKFTREQMQSMLLTSVTDIEDFNKGGSRRFYDVNSGGYISIDMNKYAGNMGTGAVDAWKFLMAIEGTPTFMAEKGKTVKIDLSGYCSPSQEYTVSIDDASHKALGLSADPVISNGHLEICCNAIGSGKITLSASVGKDPDLEGGIGGMAYTREISIISRPFATDNGGWL